MSKDKTLKVQDGKEIVNGGPFVPEGYFDELPSADASDYRFPHLVVVQPTSKLEATAGEIVDLNTKQVLGSDKAPLNFVPLWFFKTWEIYHEKGDDREFIAKEVFTPKNAMWKWEEKVNEGTKDEYRIRRYLNINVFMVLEKDLSSPMPQIVVYKFKGTSANEGKKLLTFWTNARNYKQLPFKYVWSLTPKVTMGDQGKYYVMQAAAVMAGDQHKQIEGDALNTAFGLVELIKKNAEAMTSAQLAVDDAAAEGSSAVDAGPSGPLPQEAKGNGAQLTF